MTVNVATAQNEYCHRVIIKQKPPPPTQLTIVLLNNNCTLISNVTNGMCQNTVPEQLAGAHTIRCDRLHKYQSLQSKASCSTSKRLSVQETNTGTNNNRHHNLNRQMRLSSRDNGYDGRVWTGFSWLTPRIGGESL
jgi:hypothetical protein